jgi:hypothetical protein
MIGDFGWDFKNPVNQRVIRAYLAGSMPLSTYL